MSASLSDTYIKALSKLEDLAFQRAIVQRLSVALSNFQSVPSAPQGDGALDGVSHQGTRAYCCYGLRFDAAKTSKQRARQIITKFSSDLQRLFELRQKGKAFVVHENEALARILGAPPAPNGRIGHVSLIANWFESHEPLGTLRQNAAQYAAASQCRWVRPDADIILKGPREFADQYGVDESTMLWLEHSELMVEIDQDAAGVVVPEGPTFDTKMAAAELLLPNAKDEVQQIASLLRKDWQRSIAFERHLSDRLPQLHSALEGGRRRLLARVLLEAASHPRDVLRNALNISESVFTDDFLAIYGKAMVRDLASGEVARLVGACPVNWEAGKGPDGS